MDDLASEQRIFSARLTPHRSLTQKHFRLFMILFGLISLVATLPFFLMGAWPVVGFMGLDVAIVYLAFRTNFRDARAYEEVTLTPIELHLAKVSAKGARTDWRFNPVWVRLEREEDEEFGLRRLAVASRGSSVEIAYYLGPDDKARFATDLSRGLAEARRGPRFS